MLFYCYLLSDSIIAFICLLTSSIFRQFKFSSLETGCYMYVLPLNYLYFVTQVAFALEG